MGEDLLAAAGVRLAPGRLPRRGVLPQRDVLPATSPAELTGTDFTTLRRGLTVPRWTANRKRQRGRGLGIGDWVKGRSKSTDATSTDATQLEPGGPRSGGIAETPGSEVEIAAGTAGVAPRTPESAEAAQTERWRGFIDRVTLSSIEGWAYDTHNPGAPVTIEAVTTTGKKVVAVAHHYREDVRDSGYGDGTCGFVLDLSKLKLESESVVVRFAESKHEISREPIQFDPERAALTTDMPSSFVHAMAALATEVRQAGLEIGIKSRVKR